MCFWVWTDECANQKELEQETGYAKAEVWLLDQAKFASVVAFADRFAKEGGNLRALIANAGVEPNQYRLTPDGWAEG